MIHGLNTLAIFWTQSRMKGSMSAETGLQKLHLVVFRQHLRVMKWSGELEHVRLAKNQTMEMEKYGPGRNLEKFFYFFSFFLFHLKEVASSMLWTRLVGIYLFHA